MVQMHRAPVSEAPATASSAPFSLGAHSVYAPRSLVRAGRISERASPGSHCQTNSPLPTPRGRLLHFPTSSASATCGKPFSGGSHGGSAEPSPGVVWASSPPRSVCERSHRGAGWKPTLPRKGRPAASAGTSGCTQTRPTFCFRRPRALLHTLINHPHGLALGHRQGVRLVDLDLRCERATPT